MHTTSSSASFLRLEVLRWSGVHVMEVLEAQPGGGTAQPLCLFLLGAGASGAAGKRCLDRYVRTFKFKLHADCRDSSGSSPPLRSSALASIILVLWSAGASRAKAASARTSGPKEYMCTSSAAGSTTQENLKISRSCKCASKRSSVVAAVLSGSGGK